MSTESVELYTAVVKGDWPAANTLISRNRSLIGTPITEGGETALHVAALEGHQFLVENLLRIMEASEVEKLNAKGNTALCFAAAAGHTHIARIMVKRSESLPTIKGENGLMPLYIAAQQGFEETAAYLYRLSDFGSWTDQEKISLLTTVIQSELYGLAVSIVDDHRMLAIAEDCDGKTPLLVLARNPLAFRGNKRQGCWSRIVRNALSYTISTTQSTEFDAYTLLDRLWDAMERICQEDLEAARSVDKVKLLFVAAELGNDGFLVKLLRRDHNFLYKINDSKHSIFHIAVQKHYVEVFNLIYELGGMKDLIASYIDTNGNNMLHLAAKLSPLDQLQSIPGAALQMQRDVVWYEVVEKLVCLSYKNMKNNDGLTPHEVFVAEHESLRKEGEKFMKQTAKSCMLVTMLIATVVFTAAFTVPGGYDNNKGIPILENKKMFWVFPVSEAVATLSSLTSMLMFLSILISRYSDKDFLKTLPLWLVVGVASLFISIGAMMAAFCSSILFFEHGLVPKMLLLVFFAGVPIMFVVLKYPLLMTILRCTYSCNCLFRSRNRLQS